MTVTMMRHPPCLKFLIQTMLIVCLMMQVELVCAEGEARCIERERQALLDFKAGLVDEYGLLSSWEDKRDCCQWKGVLCSNQTGHVLSLDLHGDTIENDYSSVVRFLRGNIRSSLVELQQLRYLNLSSNYFEDTHVPEFIGSLINLRYLDLSHSDFGGEIPSQLGSLSYLKYLSLGSNYYLEGSIPYQLGNLTKLQYLDLSFSFLEGTIPSQLGNLSSLHELYLGSNHFDLVKIDDGNDVGGQWMSTLTSLTHLDLSYISNLNDSHNWIQVIGNMSKLRELRLIGCGLSDHFISSLKPSLPKFKFSDSLSVLSLSGNTFTSPVIFQWLSSVTSNLVELYLTDSLLEGSTSNHFDIAMQSLERLDLSHNKIKGADLKSFMKICTLSSLNVFFNNMTEDLQSILHNLCTGCASHSLQELNLGYNQITGILPDLSIFSSLKALDLSGNQLSGEIPENILLPPRLEVLSIGSNSLEGGIPKSVGNTCTLMSLDLSHNNLSEELSVIIHHLSGCARYSLQELDLGNNQINGTLPALSIFPSLKWLSFSENKLNGKVPKYIHFPSQLETLIMNSNSLEGVITDSHFDNMSKLKVLDLSGNSLVLTFSHDWIPSFQLEVIKLGHCKLGPSFPKWLEEQINLIELDISDARISDTIPEWFWALSTKLDLLNISYNNLTGTIPNFPLRLAEYPLVSLATNQFEGPIPLFLRRAASLDLSNNKFSDLILFVCANGTAERLGQIDISNNHLSGQIPDCWGNFKSLAYIDLSNNNFSGQVPTSMGLALELHALILRNNSLIGELPSSLKSCTNLVMLDVGENKLSGVIPPWIGSNLQELQMLSLRRNHFYGSLPLSLCHLTSIHFLDLSSNNLKGRIPKCVKNFSAMTQEWTSIDTSDDHSYIVHHIYGPNYGYTYDLIVLLMWKGVEHPFKNDKLLLNGIDLSNNQLSEDIPIELVDLVELISLNLSRNNLTGKIPTEIGRLVSLEFLDLSRNHLFGSIPSSLVQIDRLTMLDLSHNNLYGKIPISTQLQSFNASSYEENQDLCGPPLENMCLEEKPHQESFALFFEAFYMSMGLGFFAGFWAVFGTVLFNRSWRHTYFRFLNNLTDRIMSRWQ